MNSINNHCIHKFLSEKQFLEYFGKQVLFHLSGAPGLAYNSLFKEYRVAFLFIIPLSQKLHPHHVKKKCWADIIGIVGQMYLVPELHS